ncbi:MAG: TetR/AcrR family transcriptional regulator [Parvibaculum sp.]|nr:TetR/AcrR family transcriptional regulator [Parvibaculum sp.]
MLNAAMQVFWRKGYTATSLDDVTAATGVNKPSLYAAFGDKPSLFRHALMRYHEMLLAYMKASLAKDPPRDSIRSWFMGFLPSCAGATATGCLSVNTTLEAASIDREVISAVEAFDRRQDALLEAAIRRGVMSGDFAKDIDPKSAALHLMAAQKGFLVLARAHPSPARTRRAMEQALSALDR